jgi:20S proteasome alpha/beta subunit
VRTTRRATDDGVGSAAHAARGAEGHDLMCRKEALMTVVLALRCADGVVLAADSQVTDSARGLSYPAQKLHPFGDTAAWGGSGARAVLMELEEEFAGGAAAVLASDNVGRAIQERVVPLLRHHYDTFIEQVPGEKDTAATPATYVMTAGYARGVPFIVDIDPHGLIGRYEEAGFHAIGSGSAMAQQAGALLAHFRMTERDVDHGVLVAVRVLDALRVTSPSVGGPVDVYRLTPERADALSEEDIEHVRERVRRWAELEREALDRLPTG